MKAKNTETHFFVNLGFLICCFFTAPFVERMMGIEPTRSAWKAEVLPLNYIRLSVTLLLYHAVWYMSRIFFVVKYTGAFDEHP